ncbi:cell wall-binding repeat-containing protein [Herbiconiux sp. YIM B11900]|uniref:cell wall-binding repeat-containing protein n=1 Tax=Herbiconiux sp. YIM B11900 TaxID=3404131 RepID=UPI003F84A046
MIRRLGGTAAAALLTSLLVLSAIPAHAAAEAPTPVSTDVPSSSAPVTAPTDPPTSSAPTPVATEAPTPVPPLAEDPDAEPEPPAAGPTPAVIDGESTDGASANELQVGVAPGNQRLSGADRYEVAITVSRAWSTGETDTVFIAKGTDYPDALSASAVAATLNAPLLLTPSDRLLPSVADRIRELAPERVIIVGGPSSVQPQVATALAALGTEVTRISGADRYEVSINLVRFAFPAGLPVLYLATGNNFPDALSASPAAVTSGGAVLLVNGWSSGLGGVTASEIRRLAPSKVVIVGGTASVNSSVESSVRSLVPSVDRIGGADRYEASANVNLYAFPSADRIFFATGRTFADALSGGALAGRLNSPLLVVAGGCVTDVTAWTVNNRFASAARTLLGGPASVGDGVYDLTVCPPPPPPAPPAPPTPPTPPAPPTVPGNPGDTKNCKDFATWAEAKAWFDYYYPYYGDVAKLDGNNDLIPCESLPGAP